MSTTKINTFPFDKLNNNILFFDKDGYNLNVDKIGDVYDFKLFFDENSSDTFKTLQLNIFEEVSGFEYQQFNDDSDEIILQKFQLFNHNKVKFSGFQEKVTFKIEKIDTTDNKQTSYGKYLFSPNIDSTFPVGSNIKISQGGFGFLTNTIYTVVGVKKDAILLLNGINNRDFIDTYGTGQVNISVSSANVIKIYDYITEEFRPKASFFSEPFFYSKLYSPRRLNIVSNNNTGVYTIENTKLNDSIYKSYRLKYTDFIGDINIQVFNNRGARILYSGDITVLNNTIITNSSNFSLLRPNNIISIRDGQNTGTLRVDNIPNFNIFNIQYNENDIVVYNGLIYECIKDYATETSSTIRPNNTEYWRLTQRIPLAGNNTDEQINSTIYLENNVIEFSWENNPDLSDKENLFLFISSQRDSFLQLGVDIKIDRRKSLIFFDTIYSGNYVDVKFDEEITPTRIYEKNIEVDNPLQNEIVDRITKQKECNILIDDIDIFGLEVTINEQIYRTDLIDTGNLPQNVDATIKNFIHLYSDTLKSQGFLLSGDNFNTNGLFNVLKIETIYPNTPLVVEKRVGTTANASFLDKIINFSAKLIEGNTLTISINNRPFDIDIKQDIANTLDSWIEKNIFILNQFNITAYRNGKSLIFIKDNYQAKNEFVVRTPGIKASQSIVIIIDKDPIYDNFVIASNMVIQNNKNIDFIEEQFATSQTISINNSVFNPNNTLYNIIGITPNELTLSYQGAYFSTDPSIDITNAFFTPALSDDLEVGDTIVLENGYTSTITDKTQLYYTVFISAINLFIKVQRNNPFGIGSGGTTGGTITNIPTYQEFEVGAFDDFKVNELDGSILCYDNDTSFLVFSDVEERSPDYFDFSGTGPAYFDFDDKFIYFISKENTVFVIDSFQNIVLNSVTIGSNIKNTIFKNDTLYILGDDGNIRVYDINDATNPIETIMGSYTDIFSDPSASGIYYYDNSFGVLENTETLISRNIGIAEKFNIIPTTNKIVYLHNATQTKVLDFINGDEILLPSQGGFRYDQINNRIIVGSYVFDVNTLDKLYEFNNTGLIETHRGFYFVVNSGVIEIYNSWFELLESIEIGDIDTIDFFDEKIFIKSNNNIIVVDIFYILINDFTISQENNITLEALPYIRYPRKNTLQNNQPRSIYQISLEMPNDDIFLYDISKVSEPYRLKRTGDDKTIFEELKFDLDYLDSIRLNDLPLGMQLNIGFNSKQEGVSENILNITQIENTDIIYTEIMTFTDIDNKRGLIELTKNSTDTFRYQITNGVLNEVFFENGQILNIKVFNGDDISINDNINVRVVKVENRRLEVDYLDDIFFSTQTTDGFSVRFISKPRDFAKIRLYGQTEIEDIRYKAELENTGKLINPDDTYIFKEYPIGEGGIDWGFLNAKRKELISCRNEIFNYIGAYRSLINSVKYFGYPDLELYEYFQNLNPDSDNYLNLIKVEIPEIFSNDDWGRGAYNSWDFPNKTYSATRLFNLTYRFTDFEGNSVITYSAEEALVKLQGLKRWLRKNIVPITHDILDITGRSDFRDNYIVFNSGYKSKIFNINDKIYPFDFTINEIYSLPINNNSQQYNAVIEFKHRDITLAPDFYMIDIKTYKTYPEWEPFVDYKFGDKVTYFGKLYESVLIDSGAVSLGQDPQDAINRNNNPRRFENEELFSLNNRYNDGDILRHHNRVYRFTEPLVKPMYFIEPNINVSCSGFNDSLNDGDSFLGDLKRIYESQKVINYFRQSLNSLEIEVFVDIAWAIKQTNINLCYLLNQNTNEIITIRNFLFNSYSSYTPTVLNELNISLNGLISSEALDDLGEIEKYIRLFIDVYNDVNLNYFRKFENIFPNENIELNKDGFILWEDITIWEEIRLHPVQNIKEKRAYDDRLKDYHFSIDSSIDPFVIVEVTSSNGYGQNVLVKRAYEIKYDADSVNILEV